MNSKTKKMNLALMIQCALFTTLIAVGAFIKVPVPFVPFTLQVMFTNLAGILLGKKYGAISVITYIFIGLIGLPIFTSGGGIGYVLHPTFGYMIGMVIGTYVAGYIVEKKNNYDYKTTMIAGLVNVGIIYLIGVPYFIAVMKLYMDSAMGIWGLLMIGFIMTIPGDIIKCILSSIIAKRIEPHITIYK